MIPNRVVESPSAFRGDVLRAEPSRIHVLDAAERDDAMRFLDAAASGDVRPTLTPGPLSEAAAMWRETLRIGIGFVHVRGLPVASHDAQAIEALYFALGRALGVPVPQNTEGELLCHIRDTGADPTSPHTRLYTTRKEQDFHTDGADIIGLLSLRGAKSGGESRIVSSVTVWNEMYTRRPELARQLFDEWTFYLGRAKDGALGSMRMPITRFDGRELFTFFIPWYIRNASALGVAEPLGEAEAEALALYESIANEPALYFDMVLEPGDLQWLKNSAVLHKRTAYEDWDDDTRRRHLLRLWLAADDFRIGDTRLRAGFSDGEGGARG